MPRAAAQSARAEVVLLFPGQGSQYLGMGKALYEAFPGVRELFQQASDLLALDLRTLCWEGPETMLVRTDNAQPAITLVNLACLHALSQEAIAPVAVAGHSLGEYAALCAAGVFTFADTMQLVRVRGAAMNDAAARHPGGMVAIFGLDIERAADVCAEVRASGVGSVEVANQNSPQQVALTGESEALKSASQLAKQRGAKLVMPLKVSGPWHSRFMSEAQDRMRVALEATTVNSPVIPVIANRTADAYPHEPEAIRTLLVEQLVRPVLWAPTMRLLIESRRRVFIEVGPGKVLSGLMRDTSREVTMLNVQDVESLEKVRTALPELPA